MGGTGGLGGLGGVVTLGQPELSVQLDSSALWLDGSNIAALDSGNRVATWDDLSGNSYDFTASGDARPTQIAAVQNGLAVVRFDGGDEYLKRVATSALVTAGSDLTAYLCVQCNIDPTYFLSLYNAASPFEGWGLSQGAGTTAGNRTSFFTSDKGGWSEDNAAIGDGDFHVITLRLDDSSGNIIFYRDGTTGDTVAGHGIGAGMDEEIEIGVTGDVVTFGAMDMAEILIFMSLHSTAQADLVESYLGAKWGVAIS